ncbi:oxidoreductase [Actinoplanes aureus]|uniref:SDR family oxidoreductase n=1 Tax=Actinoplanes aureus TaxID=2792083 RepID=A0A931CE51_9ACTN|nr:oxidoreductase [Actinoplanes aureus]MBG0565807.1 SDR family oxidoreductase [Actinoplanes aureus]
MSPRNDRWTSADVPDQRGRVVVITGANTGLGLATAKLFAAHGATVVLACRDPHKAAKAAATITAATPGADVTCAECDLASLDSVRRAAADLTTRHPRLDLLINNAGVMSPEYRRTADGFELHFGTNHLGHFALTTLLLDRLHVPRSRVVTVSSVSHRQGTIHFDDLQLERRYRWRAAYAQSKLANLLFAYELQRRLAAAGSPAISVAAHPGNAETDLNRRFPGQQRMLANPVLRRVTSWLFQSAEMGALATVRAAVDPGARGGEYYGPAGWQGFTGYPVVVRSSARSHDPVAQRRLWQESERLIA